MNMKSERDIIRLEKLISQLQSLHAEISQLTKKSPNDGLNVFKLRIVNNVLADANALLLDEYQPLQSFSGFEEDSLPTNSDVTMVLALYREQIERFRSHNVIYEDHEWNYLINGNNSGITSNPPSTIGTYKK